MTTNRKMKNLPIEFVSEEELEKQMKKFIVIKDPFGKEPITIEFTNKMKGMAFRGSMKCKIWTDYALGDYIDMDLKKLIDENQ